jgi:hypothetical protein
MAETKRRVTLPGLGNLEGVDVAVKESNERWTELILADGTTVRLKPNVLTVTRIDGKYDQEGNPIYVVNSNQIMLVQNVAPHLRQQVTGRTN